VNPRFVLRNHLAETAIRAARGDDEAERLRAGPGLARARRADEFDEVRRLARVLARPYDEQPEHAAYAAPPPDWAAGLEVSCSS
jgi:uncharacterized protein YdiU (UPF0061 family)